MKIEVGEYVRTEIGTIGKVVRINEIYFTIENNRGEIDVLYEGNQKHSKNIIDLIEVGDIVQVEEIEHVREVIEDNFFDDDVRSIIDDNNISHQIKNYQIESVVTKEQFENMEYTL